MTDGAIWGARPGGIAQARQVGPNKFIVIEDDGREHIYEYPWMAYEPQWYQLPFHKALATHRIRLAFQANRTGKTVELAWEGITVMEGNNPYAHKKPPLLGAISVLRFPKFKQYMLPHLLEFMTKRDGKPLAHYYEGDKYFKWPNGSMLFVMSDEQGEGAWEGAAFDWIGLDECHCAAVTKSAYLRTSGIKDQDGKPCPGRMFIGMTGLIGAKWICDEWVTPHRKEGKMRHLFETADIQGVKGGLITIYDNKYLSREEIEDAEATYSGWDKQVRLLGMYVPAGAHTVFDLDALQKLFEKVTTGRRGRLLENRIRGIGEYEFIEDANGSLEMWGLRDYAARYVVIGDPSAGKGLDEGVWSVWDTDRAEQVAEWASSTIDPVKWCEEGAKIGYYFNGAQIVLLTRGVGEFASSIMARYYANLWRDPKHPEKIGFGESDVSKEQMVGDANVRMAHGTFWIRSRAAIEQMMSFCRDEKKHTLRAETGRDDRAVCAMLALRFCVPEPAMTNKGTSIQAARQRRLDALTVGRDKSVGLIGGTEPWEKDFGRKRRPLVPRGVPVDEDEMWTPKVKVFGREE